jgi:YVTN family beta-propeller protein
VGGGSRAAVLEFGFAEGRLIARRTFPVTPPEKRTGNDFTGDVTFDPAGRLLYAADLFNNSIVVINPQSGVVIERFPTGRRPYRILFPPDGKTFLVSSWADGSVYHHDTATGAVLEKLRLGAHPTDMLWAPGKPAAEEEGQLKWVAARLFVAAANTNNVYVLGTSESGELRQIDTINVSLTPWQPAGMTPSALALSPDRKRLFVACSNANAVAVEGIAGARAEQLGFLPAGGYPMAIQALRDNRVVVLNGREPGTASFIDPPSDDALEAYSKTVLENTPYRDALLEDAGTGKDSPIPAQPGQTSPIRHVIYIVAANRPDGPNHRKLAREFVKLENFQALGDTRVDGEQWTTAGIASDFVEKMQPRPFDYDGGEPAAVPASGYLWTNAAAAGISMRNYGHFVVNRPLKEVAGGIQVQLVKDPVLNRATNLRYRGADPDYPDTERAKVFLEDLAEFEKTGQMPALILMRLEDDLALGRIVEAVSKSRFWPATAIFAPALAISPYVKRGAVDPTPYDTTSTLRTIELILGLRPMTVFDAGARPLSNCFQTTADPRPYTAEDPPR